MFSREELACLREDLESHLAADRRPRDLRAHCLAFCCALTRHHTGEDDGVFPELAERFPELRSILDELRRDHSLIEDALHRLEAVLGHPGQDGDCLRRELDSVAALMETHFLYEEKRIVSALNTLNVPAWDLAQPDFLLTDDG